MPPHIAAQCAPPSRPLSNAPDSTSQSIGMPVPVRGLDGAAVAVRAAARLLLGAIDEDVERGTVEVVELAAAHRPDEGPDRDAQQDQAERDEQQQDRHGAALRASRSALRVTTSDDSAMPSAASQGVT